jgi:adenosylcobinamide kinase/adenosylcobinamide-phosphate guanylyltransferase
LVTRTGDYAVRTLPAAHATGNGDVLAEEAVLFDITAPDARRLFYATDTGPFNAALLDQIRGRCFDLVLLDETFGTKFDHGHGHLDLETFPRAMQELRDMDAITEHSDVVAIHLSHHNPPTEQLRAQLLACCARVVDDGTVIEVGLRITGNSHHFILGGARSGKSHFAETIAARSSQVTYLATGYPAGEDPNWNARITAHRDRRPGHWRTEETIDLATAIEKAAAGSCLLIDCLALWLTRTLDEINGWSADPQASAVAQKEIHRRTDQLVSALNNTRAEVILVSNEVGQGVVPETSSGRLFRDLLGVVNARVAQSCHEVTFMIAGRSVPLHDLTTVRG